MTTARRRAAALLTALAAAVAGAGLAGAAPASAATQVCAAPTVPNGPVGFCIDSLTVSPTSVPNDVDATVTVTVHVSSGSPACLTVGPPYSVNAVGSVQPFTLTQSGTAGTWTGTFQSDAYKNKPGTYPWVTVNTCSANYIGYIDLYGLADHGVSVAQPLVITGTNDTAAPVLRSLSVTPATADTTTAAATFAVTARVTDEFAGTDRVIVDADPTSRTSTLSGALGGAVSMSLTRTAGSSRDGTWTGKLTMAGGTNTTWSLSARTIDTAFNVGDVSTATLAAGGLASKVTTKTTASPPTPTGVRAVSKSNIYPAFNYVLITGNAQTVGKPMATSWDVTFGSGCGGLVTTAGPGSVEVLSIKSGYQLCTFSVAAVNGFGKSKAVSVTALI